jgi:phosphatidylinositol alpha-1,6-mannosyltransferase
MRKRPRVTFAVGSLQPGGGGIAELSRQALHALRELACERAVDLRLHVLDDAAAGAGDPLFAEGYETTQWCGGNRRRFVRALLSERSDLLLFDHVGLARVHGLAAPWLRQPYLLMIHSVEIWKSRRRDYARTAHRAKLLIANSGYTARKARECYSNLPEIVVCWPGKDRAGPADSLCEGAASAMSPHTMLIVGRLDSTQRHKGHDELLQALPSVLGRVPDAQLIVAGEGDDRARLEAKSAALGVTEAVRFTGRISEPALQELYRRCALFVMPSEGDGFGLVFLEAMMHGLPCVGLEQGAAAEFLQQGTTGMLVNRDRPQDMADCLSALLLDPATRQRLGEAGRDHYERHFTRRHYGDRLRSVLENQLWSRAR